MCEIQTTESPETYGGTNLGVDQVIKRINANVGKPMATTIGNTNPENSNPSLPADEVEEES